MNSADSADPPPPRFELDGGISGHIVQEEIPDSQDEGCVSDSQDEDSAEELQITQTQSHTDLLPQQKRRRFDPPRLSQSQDDTTHTTQSDSVPVTPSLDLFPSTPLAPLRAQQVAELKSCTKAPVTPPSVLCWTASSAATSSSRGTPHSERRVEVGPLPPAQVGTAAELRHDSRTELGASQYVGTDSASSQPAVKLLSHFLSTQRNYPPAAALSEVQLNVKVLAPEDSFLEGSTPAKAVPFSKADDGILDKAGHAKKDFLADQRALETLGLNCPSFVQNKCVTENPSPARKRASVDDVRPAVVQSSSAGRARQPAGEEEILASDDAVIESGKRPQSLHTSQEIPRNDSRAAGTQPTAQEAHPPAKAWVEELLLAEQRSPAALEALPEARVNERQLAEEQEPAAPEPEASAKPQADEWPSAEERLPAERKVEVPDWAPVEERVPAERVALPHARGEEGPPVPAERLPHARGEEGPPVEEQAPAECEGEALPHARGEEWPPVEEQAPAECEGEALPHARGEEWPPVEEQAPAECEGEAPAGTWGADRPTMERGELVPLEAMLETLDGDLKLSEAWVRAARETEGLVKTGHEEWLQREKESVEEQLRAAQEAMVEARSKERPMPEDPRPFFTEQATDEKSSKAPDEARSQEEGREPAAGEAETPARNPADERPPAEEEEPDAGNDGQLPSEDVGDAAVRRAAIRVSKELRSLMPFSWDSRVNCPAHPLTTSVALLLLNPFGSLVQHPVASRCVAPPAPFLLRCPIFASPTPSAP
ncbi:hypothetical protein CYMTET_6257 [Cymbomonas tetramitiformis]|uniref:Uncharacterized protein n=1 Tax=Cymbomonas tetramitiformis TaxID=36881 RepID=A0AAE0GZD5_9CHLO|nr:hypothetical protein CYMTET_6257 [Cymbomonas tetramitiformis]